MASNSSGVNKSIEAQVRIGFGDVVISNERYTRPIDIVSNGSRDHHLQLSMTPRTPMSMACFPDIWAPNRFERMGDLFLLPARSALHARGQSRVLQSLVCRLDPEAAAQWLGADIEWTERRRIDSLNITNNDIRNLLYRISAELHDPGFASETKIELIAAQVCIELTRHLRNIDVDTAIGGLPTWRLRRIEEYLEHDLVNATLTTLASHCGLSVRHLARAFRARMGRSLGDYIAEHKMRLACKMLAEGASVKETAYAAGFSAPTNFASAFRRATGFTPRQYRERSGRGLVSGFGKIH